MSNLKIITNGLTGVTGATIAFVSPILENINEIVSLCAGVGGLTVTAVSLYKIIINKNNK